MSNIKRTSIQIVVGEMQVTMIQRNQNGHWYQSNEKNHQRRTSDRQTWGRKNLSEEKLKVRTRISKPTEKPGNHQEPEEPQVETEKVDEVERGWRATSNQDPIIKSMPKKLLLA